MSKNRQNKSIQYDLLPYILADGAELVGKYKFPQLLPQKNIPSSMPLPINYMLSQKVLEDKWFHCFVHDYMFERFWNDFKKYIPYFEKIKGIISTDFSLYRNYDEYMQIWNCRRNRAMAYAMQQINPNVIPTAGFGGENTWSWCFDGLPKNSTVAITTNGVLSDREAKRLFVGGVDALVNIVNPYAIVVCGNYPKWLNTKYPNVRIVPIFNFSQMRRNQMRKKEVIA